jgi:hypothetical protein
MFENERFNDFKKCFDIVKARTHSVTRYVPLPRNTCHEFGGLKELNLLLFRDKLIKEWDPVGS